MTERVLVSGASGFVGGQLIKQLAGQPSVVALGSVRTNPQSDYSGHIAVGEINGDTDWSAALQGQDVVVHTAARTHVMNDTATDPLLEFRSVNVAGALNLARQAAEAGLKRFIFISSIKVNGEKTTIDQPFTARDMPAPEDPYGISKWEAEQGLRELAVTTGMEVVIIRPPLVYGPGVKGNFASMIKLVSTGLPVPLGAIRNKRSLVAVDNLVDLIITCISHPGAANQTFLAADGKDLSTAQLLRGVAHAMGKPSRLIPVPERIIRFGATLLGKSAVAKRLLDSLRVDINHTRHCLNWAPPLTVRQGLQRCFETDQE